MSGTKKFVSHRHTPLGGTDCVHRLPRRNIQCKNPTTENPAINNSTINVCYDARTRLANVKLKSEGNMNLFFLFLTRIAVVIEYVKGKFVETWKWKSERNSVQEETEENLALKVGKNCNVCQRKSRHRLGHEDPQHRLPVTLDRTLGHSMHFKCFNTNSSERSSWWCDSGATRHMSNQKDLFTFIDFSRTGDVTVANGETTRYHGVGNINLKVKSGQDVLNLELKEVLYVPLLDSNLVSVKRLTKGDAKVLFDSQECSLITKDFEFQIAKYVNGLYKVNAQQESCMKVSKSPSKCIHDWHRKLAHRNLRDVKILLRHMKIRPSKCDCPDVCEACIQGKMSRSPFPRSSTVIENVFDLFVSDLCDMGKLSYGKSKYFMTFIDVRSNFTYVFFLKHKSDVKDVLINHIEMLKNTQGSKPRRIRVDRGGEYGVSGLQSYLKREGIHFETTVGYASQSNGIAERKNRELTEAARTMLIDANLPDMLWDEAVATANHVQNRLLDPKTKEIPYEIFYNRPVGEMKFHSFGSHVYHKVQDRMRRKLDPKASKLYFLGYDSHSNGFRLYDSHRKCVVLSRNVVFMDDKTDNYFDAKDNLPSTKKKNKISHHRRNSLPQDDDFYAHNKDFVGCEDQYIEIEHRIPEENNSSESESENEESESDNENLNSEYESEYDTSNETFNNTLTNEPPENNEEESSDHRIQEEPHYRRSARPNVGKPPKRYGYDDEQDGSNDDDDQRVEVLYMASCLGVYEPKTYKQAVRCEENIKWKNAMTEEISSIERNNTWELVDLPPNKNVIGCRWVFKAKPGASHHQYKARLVAQGFNQKFGVDYDEVFAPVAMDSSFRLLMSEVGVKNLTVRQFDIKSAFLNGKLEEEIYMKQPPGFESEKYPNKVLKLRKSLYGLKQAANTWNKALNKVLTDLGFSSNPADLCLYSRRRQKNDICHVLIHVDDILIASNNPHTIQRVADSIGKHFEIKDLGIAKHYLGMNIFRDKNNDVFINQSQYIDSIVSDASLQDSKVSKFPIDPGYYKINDSQRLPSNEEYRRLIGKLLYLSTHSRPDITASVCILSQKVSNPTQTDLNEVKRVIKYLKATRDLKLRLSDKKKASELKIFTDSDFAEDPVTRKSVGGYICFYNGGPISWSSRKQDIVALSSMEAEYIAMSEAVKEVIWLKALIEAFKRVKIFNLRVMIDNQSCIKALDNQKSSKRTKHIAVKYSFVRDYVKKKIIQLEYVPTHENTADLLTKPLQSTKIMILRQLAGLGN